MTSRRLYRQRTNCAVVYLVQSNHLSKEGKRYEYLVNESKSRLIGKSDVLAKRVFGEEVNITNIVVKRSLDGKKKLKRYLR